jgi:hypothetical protein
MSAGRGRTVFALNFSTYKFGDKNKNYKNLLCSAARSGTEAASSRKLFLHLF